MVATSGQKSRRGRPDEETSRSMIQIDAGYRLLSLADDLTAYVCPRGDLAWMAQARGTDTALVWCLMTWPTRRANWPDCTLELRAGRQRRRLQRRR
jgi:hypothetical protein